MGEKKKMDNQTIRQIYNGFAVKDMPFADFAKEMRDLVDPVKMRQSLAEIELMKVRQRTNKARIDRALKGKTNA